MPAATAINSSAMSPWRRSNSQSAPRPRSCPAAWARSSGSSSSNAASISTMASADSLTVLDRRATHTTSMQPVRPCSSLTAASSARLAGAEPSYPTTMRGNPADGAACAASTRGSHCRSSCTACCRSASSMAMPPLGWWGFRRPAAWRWLPGSAHEGHELRGHDDDGAHHVAVLVFEDVAVVHVAAAVGLEADGELDDLVGVDADGVLESSFVGVDDVAEFVAGVAGQAHGRGRVAVADPVAGDGDRDRAPGEDVEGLQVDVDRVGVAGEVDQLPYLPPAEHREECRRVLEVDGRGAQAGQCLAVLADDGDHGRAGVAAGRYGEFPHRHHVRPAVEFLLGERDGAPDCAAEVRLGGSGDVGGQAPGSGPARRVAGHGAEAHDVGVGQELAWVGGFGGTGGGEWVADPGQLLP